MEKLVNDRVENWKVTLETVKPISLLWDLNGLLYDVANEIYGIGNKLDGSLHSQHELNTINKKGPELLKEEFLKRVIQIIDLNIKMIKPSLILILVIDGIAPPAKASQQRARRTFAGKSTDIFNRINFTVGMPIMNEICKRINIYLSDNISTLPGI